MKKNKENSVKVSVIIPVYNAAQTLRQCLDSVCAQTLTNIEIICVDDGSTDASLDILNTYSENDFRITIVKKEHSNAGEARNAGLELASGEYLSFLDADDFFESDMLEKAYNKSKEDNAEITLFRSNQYDHTTGEYHDSPWTLRDWEMPQHRPFSSYEAKEKIFNMSSCTAWDKLFKREFIFENSILFQSNYTCDDMLFTFTAMAVAKRITTLNDIFVHQRVGNPKTLAKDIEYCTSCYYNALIELKESLIAREIYEDFKQSFVNWAIDFSLFNMHLFKDVFANLIRQQLKLRFFEELDIIGYPKENFYNIDQYNEMAEIMSEKTIMGSVENPKVSIIIPIYNAAHYLPLALDSAIYQTLDDIEIICVNDGSTDNSLEIINEYATKDTRIVVLTGKHKGYGNAVNRGLNVAKGDYVGIIKPDDFVDVDMYRQLYDVAMENELDYVIGDFYRFGHDDCGNLTLEYNEVAKRNSNYNIIHNPQTDDDVFRYIIHTWSGIYKKATIDKNNIRHNETLGISFQDIGFWFQTLIFSSRIFYINKPLYYNRRDNNDESASRGENVYCMNQEYDFIKNILNKNPKLKESFIYQYSRKKFMHYIFIFDQIDDEFKLEYLQTINKEIKEADKNEEIDWTLFDKSEYEDCKLLLEKPGEFYSREKIRYLQNKLTNDNHNSNLQSEIRTLREKIEAQKIILKTQQEKNSLLLWQCYKKDSESLDDAKKRFFRNLPKAKGDIRLMQLAILIQLLYVDRICKEHSIEYWLSFGGLLGAVRNGHCTPWDDDIDICMMRDQFELFRSVMDSEIETPVYLRDWLDINKHYNLNYVHQVFFKDSSISVCLDIFIYDYCVGNIEENKKNHIRLNRELTKKGWELHCDFYHERALEILSVQEEEKESVLKLFAEFQTKATQEVCLTNKESAKNIIWSLDNYQKTPGVNSSVKITEIYPLEEMKLEGFSFPVPKNAESYCIKMYGDIYTLPDDMLTHRHKFLDDTQRSEIMVVLKKYLPDFGLEGELESIQ